MYRFLGKVISQYISECVQIGEKRPDIIFNGFDYDRWKKMLKKVNVFNTSILLIWTVFPCTIESSVNKYVSFIL